MHKAAATALLCLLLLPGAVPSSDAAAIHTLRRRRHSLLAFIRPSLSEQQDGDTFRERESGLRFPAHLFGGQSGLHEEVVVGGGAYQALLLKIYGVTMYIDGEAAAASRDI